MLSEEGAEASNKIFRFNRSHHARQSDIHLNLLDVFRRSHHIANPKVQRILAKTLVPKRKHRPLSETAKSMIVVPEMLLQPPKKP